MNQFMVSPVTSYLCRKRNAPLWWKRGAQVRFITRKQVLVIENFVEGFYQVGLTLGYNRPSAVDYRCWSAAGLRRKQR